MKLAVKFQKYIGVQEHINTELSPKLECPFVYELTTKSTVTNHASIPPEIRQLDPEVSCIARSGMLIELLTPLPPQVYFTIMIL